MFKKILRSKIFISIILLILVGILVFGLLPMNYEKQAQTIDVVQFVGNVAEGTQITAAMLTTRTIGLYGVDNNVITNKDDIIGKYAATDIRQTTNLYSDMFVAEWEEVDGALDLLLTENDKLVTVSLGTGAKSVGGLIRPGSVVDVLTQVLPEEEEVMFDEEGNPIEDNNFFDDGKEESTELELVFLMEDVLVYEVLNNELENIADLERQWYSLVQAGDDAAEEFDSSLTPAYVTLVVSKDQALLLANQEYNGNIHLVLSPNKEAAETERKDAPVEEAEDAVPSDGPEGPLVDGQDGQE